MNYTTYSIDSVPAAFNVDSSDTSGVLYTLQKTFGDLIPGSAIIRSAYLFISNTYQYSTHRYAKVLVSDLGFDMGNRFTTDGSAAGGNVETAMFVTLFNNNQLYRERPNIPIRIRGDGVDSGYSAGAAFRILAGSQVLIDVGWDYKIQPWKKEADGIWYRYKPWKKEADGIWYKTFARLNVGNPGGFWD